MTYQRTKQTSAGVAGWQVVIESQAQIKSRRKRLFSRPPSSSVFRPVRRSALASAIDAPNARPDDIVNTHAVPFDVAFPRALPVKLRRSSQIATYCPYRRRVVLQLGFNPECVDLGSAGTELLLHPSVDIRLQALLLPCG